MKGFNMIEKNERGGKASAIKGKMTEIPPLALIEVASVMGEGDDSYPRDDNGVPNWHNISCLENSDHSLEHFANFNAERNKVDSDKEKLIMEYSHFAARALMGLEQLIREGLDA